jgi:hypothetical protein
MTYYVIVEPAHMYTMTQHMYIKGYVPPPAYIKPPTAQPIIARVSANTEREDSSQPSSLPSRRGQRVREEEK